MVIQFLRLGIYQRNEDNSPYSLVYDVIVEGEVIKTTDRFNTALIELAARIDDKIGLDL